MSPSAVLAATYTRHLIWRPFLALSMSTLILTYGKSSRVTDLDVDRHFTSLGSAFIISISTARWHETICGALKYATLTIGVIAKRPLSLVSSGFNDDYCTLGRVYVLVM